MNTTSYASNLSQAERLELASGTITIPRDSIGEDERCVLSTPPNGFRMPSMSAVREHDARMSAYGSDVNVLDNEEDEEDGEDEGEEGELRQHTLYKRMDGMREHSFRLPSQRSRGAVSDALRFMGMGYND